MNLLAEHRLDAEPHGPERAGYDDGQDSLERQALRLLDAVPPFAQMDEVELKFLAVVFLDPERCQDRCNGFEDNLVQRRPPPDGFLFEDGLNDRADFIRRHFQLPDLFPARGRRTAQSDQRPVVSDHLADGLLGVLAGQIDELDRLAGHVARAGAGRLAPGQHEASRGTSQKELRRLRPIP